MRYGDEAWLSQATIATKRARNWRLSTPEVTPEVLKIAARRRGLKHPRRVPPLRLSARRLPRVRREPGSRGRSVGSIDRRP